MITKIKVSPEPDHDKNICYLCHSPNIKIKFPSTHSSIEMDSNTYCCTSFGHNKHDEIVECLDCGLLAVKEIPNPSELEQNYKQVIDPLYLDEKESRYLTFRKVVKEVQMYVPDGKILDVGCYCGYFLDVARESGYEVEGLELSKWASDHARLSGLVVHNDTLSSLKLDGHFDLITMWDVVEHFSDPRAELHEINRLLKKHGYLFLSTINVGSIVARLMGPRWPWLMDMHIFYFNPNTITKILEQEGFRIVRIQNYTHIISSKYFITKLAHISHIAELIFKALHRILGEFKIPFNLGDNMMVIAQKVQD